MESDFSHMTSHISYSSGNIMGKGTFGYRLQM